MYMYLPSMPHTTKLGVVLNADKSCVLRIRTTAEEHPVYLRDEGDMPRLEDRLDLYFQSRLHEPYRINPQRRPIWALGSTIEVLRYSGSREDNRVGRIVSA